MLELTEGDVVWHNSGRATVTKRLNRSRVHIIAPDGSTRSVPDRELTLVERPGRVDVVAGKLKGFTVEQVRLLWETPTSELYRVDLAAPHGVKIFALAETSHILFTSTDRRASARVKFLRRHGWDLGVARISRSCFYVKLTHPDDYDLAIPVYSRWAHQ